MDKPTYSNIGDAAGVRESWEMQLATLPSSAVAKACLEDQLRVGCNLPPSNILASSIFIHLRSWVCPRSRGFSALPVCLPVRVPMSAQCLRHPFQQMERRKSRGRVRQREERRRRVLYRYCISANIGAFVTGKKQGR